MTRQLSTSHPRWAPYVFMAPFVLIFCTFMVYPLVQSIVLAMQQTFGPKTTVFVGLKNFTDLFADRFFWLAMRNTFVFAVASVASATAAFAGVGHVAESSEIERTGLFRLIFFSPSLVGIVFVAMMFALMFHEREGLVNAFLRAVIPHFPREFPWLQRYVMPALIIASLVDVCRVQHDLLSGGPAKRRQRLSGSGGYGWRQWLAEIPRGDPARDCPGDGLCGAPVADWQFSAL